MTKSESRRPPAMTDVAALAGVSHQTVSRVINDSQSVRPETRQKVLDAIAELGYRRNEAARALATSRSRLIGIITTQFTQYGPSSTLLSVQMAAREAGYYIVMASLSDFSEESQRSVANVFQSQGVAGIILIAPVTEIAEGFGKLDVVVPAVAISSSWSGDSTNVSRVGVDQREGARMATRHLLEQGCQNIAHFAGPQNWFDAQVRRDGWHDALAEAGAQPGIEFEGDWSPEAGYQMAQDLLNISRSDARFPDGLFVANDRMALGALRAFTESGIKVPEELCVVGFDDESGAAFYYPSLSTVRQDFAAVGAKAVDAMTELLAGNAVENELVLPELVVRGSTSVDVL